MTRWTVDAPTVHVSTMFSTVEAPSSLTVSGNVGAGTGRVSVTTMSGAVTLLRRAAVTTGGFEPPGPPVAGMESKTQ